MYIQRPLVRHFTTLPRLATTLLRVPVAAAATGMGVTAYVHYQVQDKFDYIRDFAASIGGLFTFNGPNEESKDGSNGSNGSEGQDEGVGGGVGAAILALSQDSKDERKEEGEERKDEGERSSQQLNTLTKTLIEIGRILKGERAQLNLPSIVVIGSQSSGKSSVLEAIVGSEFLPKGKNMATRRPIELTLVNIVEGEEEYCYFPQLGVRVGTFGKVQEMLQDLNDSVQADECVSTDAIELTIYSQSVPDLRLVDLPGYIQLESLEQPAYLKEKITELCERYLEGDNIILAVCAADVDLANSEALRACRRVDREGLRSIGVVTKMDLVGVEEGKRILMNEGYKLPLGYIGVICNSNSNNNSNTNLKSSSSSTNSKSNSNTERKSDLKTGRKSQKGIEELKKKLGIVLREKMEGKLQTISHVVRDELEQLNYVLKAEYNDRLLSSESYVLELVDTLKESLKHLQKSLGKDRIYSTLFDMFQNDRFESVDTLSKSQIGRRSVEKVIEMVMCEIDLITNSPLLKDHPQTKIKIKELVKRLLKERERATMTLVENTIKQFKYNLQINQTDWTKASLLATKRMERDIADENDKLLLIRKKCSRRELKEGLAYLAFKQANPTAHTSLPQSTLDLAERARSIKDSLQTLKMKIFHLKSQECSRPPVEYSNSYPNSYPSKNTTSYATKNTTSYATKITTSYPNTHTTSEACIEPLLTHLTTHLTQTALTFIHIELLNDFYFTLPRQLENVLYYSLDRAQIDSFCKENKVVGDWLELGRRKERLESVVRLINAIH